MDRAKNEEADALAKAAARGKPLPSDVFFHTIDTPAVRSPEGLQITNDSEGHRIVNLIMTEDWRAPITRSPEGAHLCEGLALNRHDGKPVHRARKEVEAPDRKSVV